MMSAPVSTRPRMGMMIRTGRISVGTRGSLTLWRVHEPAKFGAGSALPPAPAALVRAGLGVAGGGFGRAFGGALLDAGAFVGPSIEQRVERLDGEGLAI